ncbi:MAG: RNA-directed DNA polymerase [Nitrospinae bacterium]|nr:RNA-directed DNA polymerase [Nitrospinota bacterium]
MKRYGGLFESIATFPALLAASRKARKGKRFKHSTADFEFNLEREIIRLERALTNQTYRPGPYREFSIYEPKPRKISAAPYRDRVAQHALCAVIEPLFNRSFIFDNYACRTGKGNLQAVNRFTHFSRRFKYVLKCDVKKYFPSIDHQVLKDKIRRKIKCPKTLWLIDLFIDSSHPQDAANFYFPGDDLFTPYERRRGIPIGNLTSQLFANLYLNDLDHFIKEKFPVFGYIRYMDDLAVFGDRKEELWRVLECVKEFLVRERLWLKPEKSMVYPLVRGVDYLGFKVFPDHRRLRYENTVRYRRRVKRMQKDYYKGKIGFAEINGSVQSWIGHVGHADTWRFREKLFKDISFQRCGT